MMQITSQREHVLAIVAVTLAAAVCYGTLRLKPALGEVESIRNEIAQAEADRQAMNLQNDPIGQLEDAREKQTMLEAEIRELQDRLADLESRWVSVDSPSQVESLKASISMLADKHGVKILKTSPHEKSTDKTKKDLFTKLMQGTPPRSAHRLVVRSDFKSLRRFVRSLLDLPKRIAVMRFDVVVETDGDTAAPVLNTEMLILL